MLVTVVASNQILPNSLSGQLVQKQCGVVGIKCRLKNMMKRAEERAKRSGGKHTTHLWKPPTVSIGVRFELNWSCSTVGSQ